MITKVESFFTSPSGIIKILYTSPKIKKSFGFGTHGVPATYKRYHAKSQYENTRSKSSIQLLNKNMYKDNIGCKKCTLF